MIFDGIGLRRSRMKRRNGDGQLRAPIWSPSDASVDFALAWHVDAAARVEFEAGFFGQRILSTDREVRPNTQLWPHTDRNLRSTATSAR